MLNHDGKFLFSTLSRIQEIKTGDVTARGAASDGGDIVTMGQRSYTVDILSVLFGIGTWVVVNGLWVELPLLVQTTPEGWNLPSYLTIVVQIANIAPLLYSLLHSFYPNHVTETRVIYGVMALGLIANGFLVFYWDRTGYFLGANRSTALLGLSFCLALVDTSSRVLYLPFMARFQGMYLTSFFIGEGLSGFVPSIFALVQGVGGNPECQWTNVTTGNVTELQLTAIPPSPLFSIEVFFVLLFVTVLTSLVAFHLLRNESLTRMALVTFPVQPSLADNVLLGHHSGAGEQAISSYRSMSPSQDVLVGPDVASPLSSPLTNNNYSDGPEFILNVKSPLFLQISKPAFIYLLLVQSVVCALANGIFPSIQSFSSLPYGNVAYHWSATLSTMTNPAVCFLLFVLPKPTKVSITSVLVASIGIACYVMTTAVQSPSPPLVGETGGEVLLVLGWVLLVGSFTYVKVSVATLLREEGKRGLFWCGAITQCGSAVGAITMFLIVNQTKIFKSYDACQDQGQGNSSTLDPFQLGLEGHLENLLV